MKSSITKKFIFFMFIIIAAYHSESVAQSVIKGFVYEDRNKNNIKDKNEKGIPAVAVSNGTDVVTTNPKGKYTLTVTPGNIVFVIKPSGYTVPVNQFNQPRFYYIHKPEGSPSLKYEGQKPTDPVPEPVNFALIPSEKKENFKILVFGDPQPYNLDEVDFFYRGIVKELENVQGIDFGLSLGDLVGDNLDLFQPYIEAVDHIGVPWYNVIGNHDINYDGSSDNLTDETFEKYFGPATYSFNHGKVHFIILDDILYPDPRDGKGYWGGLREDQLEFIENDLKYVPKDFLILLAMHIPLSEEIGIGGDAFRDEDRNKLFELMKEFPYTLSLSAHTHYQCQDFLFAKDGWLQERPHHHYNVGTTSGDWYSGKLNKQGVPVSTMRDGTPKGYAFLSFDKNQYRIDYKVAGKSSDYQFNIHAPRVVEQHKSTTSAIVANFFIGSEYDTLMYRVDGGEWREMHYFSMYDPIYLYEVLTWDFTDELPEGRRPSNPVECSHTWVGRIPTDLDTGEHVIEVKAIDMFGRTFTQERKYRIVVRPE